MMTLRDLQLPAQKEILVLPILTPFPYELFQRPFFEIPRLFHVTISNTAVKFLKGHVDMVRLLSQVLEICEEIVSRQGATATIFLYGYKGTEHGERETLVVKFEVYNKTFREILDIWDDASKAVQEKMSYKALKKLVISFERPRSSIRQSSL